MLGIGNLPDPTPSSTRKPRVSSSSPAATIVLMSVAALLALNFLWVRPLIDLHVYEQAGRVFAHGDDVYQIGFGQELSVPLPYTYPPPLAGLMALLASVPRSLLGGLWTIANLMLLVWVVKVSYRPLLQRLGDRSSLLGFALLVGVMAFTTPVTDVMHLGQVGLALMALVFADTLPEKTKLPRGLLVGIAAAIKLTPVAFIGYWIVVRRWRAAAVASATAVGIWSVAALARPRLSIEYWSKIVFDPRRLGDIGNYRNQSLDGLLTRFGVGQPLIWMVLAAITMMVALTLARSAHLRGDELRAVTLVGMGTLVASPVSWTHHAVWIIPATGLILDDGRTRRRVGLWLVTLAVFMLRIPELGRLVVSQAGMRFLGLSIQGTYVATFLLILIMLRDGSHWPAADSRPRAPRSPLPP